MADAAHLVAVPAIVADHLGAFVGTMLGDGGQEVGGAKDLEVAVDLGIELGAVDDGVGGESRVILSTEKVCRVMMMPGTPLEQLRAVRRYSVRLLWAREQSFLRRGGAFYLERAV